MKRPKQEETCNVDKICVNCGHSSYSEVVNRRCCIVVLPGEKGPSIQVVEDGGTCEMFEERSVFKKRVKKNEAITNFFAAIGVIIILFAYMAISFYYSIH